MTPAEIRQARETLGLDQDELAHALGYSRYSTVSDWERGVKPINATAALLLQAYLAGYKSDL